LTQDRIAAADGRFNRIRQVAPICPPMWTLAPPGEYDWTCASFGHPSPQPKRQIHRFSHFCTAHGRKSLYFTMGDHLPTNCPFSSGIWTHLTHDSLGHSEPTTQTASRSV